MNLRRMFQTSYTDPLTSYESAEIMIDLQDRIALLTQTLADRVRLNQTKSAADVLGASDMLAELMLESDLAKLKCALKDIKKQLRKQLKKEA